MPVVVTFKNLSYFVLKKIMVQFSVECLVVLGRRGILPQCTVVVCEVGAFVCPHQLGHTVSASNEHCSVKMGKHVIFSVDTSKYSVLPEK